MRTSRLLSYEELKPVKGIRYSRTHIKRLEDAGLFPKRVHPVEGSQQIGWFDHERDEHLAARAAARDREEAPAMA